MTVTNDDGSPSPFATMLTNFDSTQQKAEWNRLRDSVTVNDGSQRKPATAHVDQQDVSVPGIRHLWERTQNESTCERVLHTHPQFLASFSGVLRTAYLYCPMIMITDAELIDGIFFQAFGPSIVNSLVGRIYERGHFLVVSGRWKTFDECLRNFFLSTVEEVRGDARKKSVILSEAAQNRKLPDDWITLRPINSCVFDFTVTHDLSLTRSPGFYVHLTNQLRSTDAGNDLLPDVIAEAYGECLNAPSADVKCRFDLLIQRWREWREAIRNGEVRYVSQNSEEGKRIMREHRQPTFQGKNFDGIFASVASDNLEVMSHACDRQRGGGSDTDAFVKVMKSIAGMPKRSDAFAAIDCSDLPETGDAGPEGFAPSKALLRDWYQFVYQRTLAIYLGACLIAVKAPRNSYEQVAGRHMAESVKVDDSAGFVTGSWAGRIPLLRKVFHRHRSLSLMIAGSITDILGMMPAPVFAHFCYESRSAILKWRSCTPTTPIPMQRHCAKDAAYLVHKVGEEHSLRDDAKSMLTSTGVAVVLAFVSAVSDNLMSGNGTASVWIIVLVAWVIAIVPDLADVVRWLWGVHSTSKTVVYLAE